MHELHPHDYDLPNKPNMPLILIVMGRMAFLAAQLNNFLSPCMCFRKDRNDQDLERKKKDQYLSG